MAQLAGDVRGVMIPVTGASVLLPNATVSEVITYGEPQEIENAPNWVAKSTMVNIVTIDVVVGNKATAINRFSALITADSISRIPDINTIGNNKRNIRLIDNCISDE